MSISAIVSIDHLLATNAALEAAGHGAGNFSIPCYAGPGATHAALHCWWSPAFLASLQLIPEVTILSGLVDSGEVGEDLNPILVDLDPIERTRQVIEDAGAQWGVNSSELPSSGTVAAGSLYRVEGDLWYVIQSFSRSVYGAHPSTYPALIRRVRNPYAVEEWTQPLDQFDAYRIVNPFTGKPDEAIRNGQEWYVTGVDGAGNNVWTPGIFGWTVVGDVVGPDPEPEPEPEPDPDPNQPPAWSASAVYTAGMQVTHAGQVWTAQWWTQNEEPGTTGQWGVWR
jgi:hypothetical protein